MEGPYKVAHYKKTCMLISNIRGSSKEQQPNTDYCSHLFTRSMGFEMVNGKYKISLSSVHIFDVIREILTIANPSGLVGE